MQFCTDFEFSKTLNVDLGSEPNTLVVNGIIYPNEPYSLMISQTQSVLQDEYPHFIENAQVIIYQNNLNYDTLQFDGSQFKAQRFLRTGNSYQFSIKVDGFDEAKTEWTFPERPILDHLSVEELTVTEEYGFEYKTLSATFTINDTQDKSYYLMVIKDKDTGSPISWKSRDAVFIQSGSGDINTDNTIQEVDVYNYIWFNDDLFSGKNREITISIPNYGYGFETQIIEYEIFIYGISNDLFEFLRRFKLQDETRSNPFSEPVEVFGNLENAYGVLTGMNASTLSIYYAIEGDGGRVDVK